MVEEEAEEEKEDQVEVALKTARSFALPQIFPASCVAKPFVVVCWESTSSGIGGSEEAWMEEENGKVDLQALGIDEGQTADRPRERKTIRLPQGMRVGGTCLVVYCQSGPAVVDFFLRSHSGRGHHRMQPRKVAYALPIVTTSIFQRTSS